MYKETQNRSQQNVKTHHVKPKFHFVAGKDYFKEGGFVDLKAIERSSGGGVKTSHIRMILQALAQGGISKGHFFIYSVLHQFHGAWMVWMRGAVGMGEKTKEEVKI